MCVCECAVCVYVHNITLKWALLWVVRAQPLWIYFWLALSRSLRVPYTRISHIAIHLSRSAQLNMVCVCVPQFVCSHSWNNLARLCSLSFFRPSSVWFGGCAVWFHHIGHTDIAVLCSPYQHIAHATLPTNGKCLVCVCVESEWWGGVLFIHAFITLWDNLYTRERSGGSCVYSFARRGRTRVCSQ